MSDLQNEYFEINKELMTVFERMRKMFIKAYDENRYDVIEDLLMEYTHYNYLVIQRLNATDIKYLDNKLNDKFCNCNCWKFTCNCIDNKDIFKKLYI